MTGSSFSGWLSPEQVFDGERLIDNASVFIQDGVVKSIDRLHATAKRINGTLTPGFLDIQVNGGGGVLFNEDPTVQGIEKIVAAHRQFGTTRLLPTVITDTPEVLTAACQAICDGIEISGVAGIHIEGPHISKDKAGVHRQRDIRPLDEHTMALLQRLRDRDIPVLITVAPEAVAPGQIAKLVQMGVVVSLGHSNASIADIEPCLAEGVALFTHLFNAMSPMAGREPGMVGSAINSQAYCSVICDGLHVAPDMLALAIRARPRSDRMIIVSDAMPTVGGSDSYQLYGERIKLHGHRLQSESGALAGAHITMAQSIDILMGQCNVSREQCLQMAITHPYRLMMMRNSRCLIDQRIDDCLILSDRATNFSFLHQLL